MLQHVLQTFIMPTLSRQLSFNALARTLSHFSQICQIEASSVLLIFPSLILLFSSFFLIIFTSTIECTDSFHATTSVLAHRTTNLTEGHIATATGVIVPPGSRATCWSRF